MPPDSVAHMHTRCRACNGSLLPPNNERARAPASLTRLCKLRSRLCPTPIHPRARHHAGTRPPRQRHNVPGCAMDNAFVRAQT